MGAPRDNYRNPAWRNPDVDEPGAVWMCSITSGSCEQLNVDSQRKLVETKPSVTHTSVRGKVCPVLWYK